MVTKRARLWLSRGGVIAALVVVLVGFGSIWLHAGQLAHSLLTPPDHRGPDRIGTSLDPASAGVDATEVLLGGPLGDYPAWMVDGTTDRWVIFVHGIDTDRREALRVLPLVADAGYSSLVMSYRNDGVGPAEGSGRHHFGTNEWPDLRAAIQFARSQGAVDVVLYGFGSGASVIGSFLANGGMEDIVVGVVLDAPALDPPHAAARLSAGSKVPDLLARWSRAMVTFRFGMDLSTADFVSRADVFTSPVLVIHGLDDLVYDPTRSAAFVEAAETASVLFVPGAGHGEAWNVDPVGYETAVRDFLDGLAEAEGVDEEAIAG